MTTLTYKRVVTTPAGRKRYLKILLHHLYLQRDSFDKWQIWANTNNREDLTYIRQIERDYDFIEVIQIPEVLNTPLSTLNICKFFKYACDPDTVYIRLDDDIIYIEPGFLDKLFEFRINHPEYFLVYGNIINNAVIAFFHQQNNLVKYKDKVKAECMDKVGWADPKFCEALHLSFLQSLNNKDISKWRESFKEYVLENYERCSINCISWLGKEFAMFNGKVGNDEEQWLSVDKPKSIKKPNAIYEGAICVHFAFYIQRDYIEKETNILQDYAKLVGIKVDSNANVTETTNYDPQENIVVSKTINPAIIKNPWLQKFLK